MAAKTDKYTGPVVFVDGVHYPVGRDGHADKSRGGLRWVSVGVYRYADPADALHNHQHATYVAELEPGTE